MTKDAAIKMYSRLAAKSEGLALKDVTAETLAENMIRSGLDLKGQSQMGLLASGYGGGAEVSAGVGFAVIEGGAKAARLGQSLLIALHGPWQLDGQMLDTPLALYSLTGSKWTGSFDAKASVGFVAETGFELGSSGPESKTEVKFTGPEQADEDLVVEGLAARASAFAGLTVSAGADVAHYSGVDAAPVYFATRSELKQELGAALKGGDRLTALKLEANRLFNEVRQAIIDFEGNSVFPKNDGSKDTYKQRLGVWDTWLGAKEMMTGTSDPPALYEARLAKLLDEDKGQSPMLAVLFKGRVGCNQIRARAQDLKRRFAQYSGKSSTAICALRMWSAEGKAGVAAVATAKAELTTPFAGGSAGMGLHLGAGGSYKRTGIRFQAPFIDQEGPVFCTQDTSITYGSLNVAALATAAFALNDGNRKSGHEISTGCERHLNTMSYQSATLYWKCASAKATVKPGSGVSFGRSFVIKNLVAAMTPGPKRNVWLESTAAALRVTVKQLEAFLADGQVKARLDDLKRNSQRTRTLWGGFDPLEVPGWDDRAVLLEASFTVENAGDIAVKDSQPAGFKEKLMKAKRTLQAIRLRYRILDFDTAEHGFRLGFKLLGVGVGIQICQLEEAGAEGIVDLRTVWFAGDVVAGDKDPDDRYNAEHTVPAVTLFCQ